VFCRSFTAAAGHVSGAGIAGGVRRLHLRLAPQAVNRRFKCSRASALGVTDSPAAFCVKLGKVLELSYTKNGPFVMLGLVHLNNPGMEAAQ
jgi:hypothetical protein